MEVAIQLRQVNQKRQKSGDKRLLGSCQRELIDYHQDLDDLDRRLIGFQKATALMMLGDKVTAEEAEELGMIFKVISSESFNEEVEKLILKYVEDKFQCQLKGEFFSHTGWIKSNLYHF